MKNSRKSYKINFNTVLAIERLKKPLIDKREPVYIFFFYIDWCPLCMRAKYEWDKYVSEFENSIVNGYKIIFHVIECSHIIECDHDMHNIPGEQSKPAYNNIIRYMEQSLKTIEIVHIYEISIYPTVKMSLEIPAYGRHTLDIDSQITYDNLKLLILLIHNFEPSS